MRKWHLRPLRPHSQDKTRDNNSRITCPEVPHTQRHHDDLAASLMEWQVKLSLTY